MFSEPLTIRDMEGLETEISNMNRADTNISSTVDKSGATISFVLPGYEKEEIKLSVTDGLLDVVAINASGNGVHKPYRLSKTYDLSRVSATLRNGILKVYLPFLESAKPRSILID